MRRAVAALGGLLAAGQLAVCQNAFNVTGTQIPAALVQQNYGKPPKGVTAYDLNICNVSGAKQSIVSSEIYQAFTASNGAIQPIGREIMLAAILRNQSHSMSGILNIAMNTASTAMAILSSSKYHLPSGFVAGAALASVSGQQVLADLKPVLSADQLEKFESQVLEPALVLDAGSCVERTVFAAQSTAKAKPQGLSFHVR